ncbi:MAG TPA: malonyl-CoA synthase [Xanthobacteraceae bacterium]|nr:malonyl-CoA synthase [Xanthobacteraceae bacterium]
MILPDTGNFATWALERDPSSIFVRTDEGRAYTYGETASETARYAALLKELGVKPGDRILVQVEKCVEVIFLYLGCLRAGAVFLPLNNSYTSAELDYFIGDARPCVIVAGPGDTAISELAKKHCIRNYLTLGPNHKGSLLEQISLAFSGRSFLDCVCEDGDLAAIVYTSGTTGRSKGAMITHGNLRSNAVSLSEIWRFSSADTLLHALPLFHIHGLFVATNVVMAAGASMKLLNAFNADRVLDQMSNATVMMGVPTFYTRLLQHPALERSKLAHMRLFVSGSAPLLAETHLAWTERTGHEIVERYGMTETGIISSCSYDGPRVPGTVGCALPGTTIRITREGNEVPAEEIGMIEVKGPGVFKGYWQMPEKTAAEFTADGFFVTGDLGRKAKDGTLQIVGRDKDLVISGGFNIYPKEIETELDQLPGVVESAVIGVPHPDFGEGLTAVIVGAASEKDVIAGLNGTLAKFKIPKRVLVVDELPRNAMGKVQKNVLRDRYSRLFQPQ